MRRYFSDAFAAKLDFDGGGLAVGDEVKISYGERTNDVLLQYYGFVESGNPHEAYVLEQEQLIVALNEAAPLPSDALQTLQAAGLVSATNGFQFIAGGVDPATLRVARLLTHPTAAMAADEGNSPLPGGAESATLRALEAVALARLEALPAEGVASKGLAADIPASTIEAFVAEKRRVLAASAAALADQAVAA